MIQALYAFARGGMLGTGLGGGLPQVGGGLPIPAIHTDFPFAALGEELGLIGVLAILGPVPRRHRAGPADRRRAADDFRALLAAGLALVVGVQAFIIAAGNLKLIPLTGITLPFISYGGSSLLANAWSSGCCWRCPTGASSRHRRRRPAPRWRRLARRAARLMLGPSGDRSRPLGRGDDPRRARSLSVAFAVLAGGAGYWGVSARPELIARAGQPGRHRGGAERAAGRILDRDGDGARQQQGRRERRAVPRLHEPGR